MCFWDSWSYKGEQYCDVSSNEVKKVKQPYLISITRDSNSTRRHEVNGVLILSLSLSMLRFKGI